MFKKIVAVITIAFLSVNAFSQQKLNDYKYVVVPFQFDFVKGKNKFQLNSLTRHLFNTNGFKAFFEEEELPQDLFNNRCLAVYADVIKPSGVFTTKMQIVLKDCFGKQVFISSIAKTKEKDLKVAYSTAIREAFESIKFLNYTYNPDSDIAKKYASKSSKTETSEELAAKAEEAKIAEAEVARLKKEVEDLKQQKEAEMIQANAEAEQKALMEEKARLNKEKENLKAEEEKQTETIVEAKSKSPSDVLYAQPIENGFQVVDTSPKVIMVLLKTAAPNVYTVKGKDAIVFKENDVWIYSENGSKKPLNIKF